MSRSITCLLLGAAAAALTVTSALAYDWSMTNSSHWAIHRVFISPCSSQNWGHDRLGENDVMSTGESYVLNDVGAGCYDVKLVDEDGDVCVISGVRINNDLEWEITDKNLLNCESQ